MSEVLPAPEPSASARVLEWLGYSRQRTSLARLSKQLGLAQSQARRALSGLQQLGLVQIELAARRTLVSLTEQGQHLLGAEPGLAQVQRQRVIAPSSPVPPISALDWVIEEAPVALLYNGHAHVVMMLTPVDLEDFALGYSLAEGIVDRPEELQLVETQRHGAGFALHLHISQARFDALLQRGTRSAAGSASCGLCGTRELSEALLLPAPSANRTAAAPVELITLHRAFAQMRQLQVLNARCGAAHAAASLLPNAGMLLREDIGRHTAVDKLIGAMARSGQPMEVLLLTSRLSFEIVRKAAQVGAHTIAAISAPSALALRSASALGITVWGFVRDGQGNHYLPEPGSKRSAEETQASVERLRR